MLNALLRMFARVSAPSQEASLVYKRGSIVTGHVPRLGYVTLFPLLLGLLPHDSPKLGHTLDILAVRPFMVVNIW